MNTKLFALIGVAALLVLVASSVYAYQYGNKNNTQPSIDRSAAEAALENNDYSAWKALHVNAQGRMSQLITNESQFQLLRQMHEAQESGDFAKVKELKTQLGFNQNQGKGMMQGMHKGNSQGQRKGMGNGNCPYA